MHKRPASQDLTSVHRPVRSFKIWDTDDLKEWHTVCSVGSYLLLAKENHRRLVDPETWEIKIQYEVPFTGAEGKKEDGV